MNNIEEKIKELQEIAAVPFKWEFNNKGKTLVETDLLVTFKNDKKRVLTYYYLVNLVRENKGFKPAWYERLKLGYSNVEV